MADQNIILSSGKRKTAIARATCRQGRGKIIVNKILVTNIEPKLARLTIMEPIQIAGDWSKKVNMNVKVHGGGVQSQAEAARLAIARAFVDFSKDPKVKSDFLKYDRHLLVADTRRKEMYKPGDSKARSKRQKSYR
ncbi:30S ribosomal protein S9 [archaeon]|nr:30S ribosomal protein S9 [archaeon]|tara:strand:- start:258 stop:665 length:408 start_codon:yes stop_codon:yes gene_type:complete